MEALPGGARIALLVVIALLLVTLGFALALVLLGRRRDEPGAESRELEDELAYDRAWQSSRRHCPTCRSDYADTMTYCPRDGRRLVEASEGEIEASSPGGVCPRCQRAYEPGIKRCPDDGQALTPAAIAEVLVAPSEEAADDAGVIGKICPRCRSRHELAASFCGRDGSRLVALN